MNPQLSQDYTVDSRYSEAKNALDNAPGKAFLTTFINRMREEQKPGYGSDLGTEDRYIVNGAGGANYTFKNGFKAKQ